MTKAEAIAMLKRIQEPEAWEPQITQAAFEALDMAIEALDCSESPNSSDTISRQAAIKYLMTNMNWYDDDYKRECITELINGVPSCHPHSQNSGGYRAVSGCLKTMIQ